MRDRHAVASCKPVAVCIAPLQACTTGSNPGSSPGMLTLCSALPHWAAALGFECWCICDQLGKMRLGGRGACGSLIPLPDVGGRPQLVNKLPGTLVLHSP